MGKSEAENHEHHVVAALDLAFALGEHCFLHDGPDLGFELLDPVLELGLVGLGFAPDSFAANPPGDDHLVSGQGAPPGVVVLVDTDDLVVDDLGGNRVPLHLATLAVVHGLPHPSVVAAHVLDAVLLGAQYLLHHDRQGLCAVLHLHVRLLLATGVARCRLAPAPRAVWP